MNEAIGTDIRELTDSIHYRPCISIILPFEPKMNAKAEISQQLKFAVDKVEREIKINYPNDLGQLVISKLQNIIRQLNFSTYKRSIAIYVSPVFEKVLYLDIPVQEKIMVDGSFEIRDLLYAKKEMHQYLILFVSGNESKVYLGNLATFLKLKSNVPDHIAAFRSDLPSAVANFQDSSSEKERLLKKFLRHSDEGLTFLLQAYPLPVFVVGAEKTLGYYKAITKNEKSIVAYVQGNHQETSDSDLHKILQPYLDNWRKVKLDDLRHQMEKAADSGKLAIGLQEVWKQASLHKGKLLILEKNFQCPAEQTDDSSVIRPLSGPYNRFSYIKDAVDDIIEKVLLEGGDVEFVEDGSLNDFQHITLIQHY